MMFFYSQIQNTLTQPFFYFLVYFFLKMFIKQSSTTYLRDYLKIHICRLKVPFHGAHHNLFFVPTRSPLTNNILF